MKTFIAVLAALALSATAYATGGGSDHEDHGHANNKTPPQTQSQGQSQGQVADADSSSVSSAKSNAASVSSSNSNSGASSISGDSSAASNSGGNSQTTNYTTAKNPVNTAIAGVGETTADCRYHDGAGIQLLGVGLSGGKSRKDADCARLKLAEYLYSRGNDIAADRVMCSITLVKDALGEDCIALVNQVHPTPIPATRVSDADRDRIMAQKLTSK